MSWADFTTASPIIAAILVAGAILVVDLIRPGPDVPLRIRTVSLAPTGATITATIDASALSD